MKFSCLSDDLLRAVSVVAALLPKVKGRVVDQCVLLSVDVKKKTVYAVCCDGTQTVRCMVRGSSPEESGDYLVKAAVLMEVLSVHQETEFVFSGDDDDGESLFARAAFAEHEMEYQVEASRYPVAPVVDLGSEDYPAFTVGRDAFLEAIDKVRLVAKSATKQDHRFAIAGVSLWPVLGDADAVCGLVLVSTDALSLIRTELPATPWGTGVVKERSHLNPAVLLSNAVMLLGKLFSDAADETLTVCLAANFIVISSGRNLIRMRMLEGQYPHYEDILKPAKSALKLTVPAGEFIHCARLAAVCCDPEEPVIEVEVGEGFIKMHSKAKDLKSFGISRAEFPIGEDGEGLKIGLRPKLLFEIKRLFSEEDMLLVHLNPKAGVMLVKCERLSVRCALATFNLSGAK